jgi:hypothetical protein
MKGIGSSRGGAIPGAGTRLFPLEFERCHERRGDELHSLMLGANSTGSPQQRMNNSPACLKSRYASTKCAQFPVAASAAFTVLKGLCIIDIARYVADVSP